MIALIGKLNKEELLLRFQKHESKMNLDFELHVDVIKIYIWSASTLTAFLRKKPSRSKTEMMGIQESSIESFQRRYSGGRL